MGLLRGETRVRGVKLIACRLEPTATDSAVGSGAIGPSGREVGFESVVGQPTRRKRMRCWLRIIPKVGYSATTVRSTWLRTELFV